jgi:hypothetical protein
MLNLSVIMNSSTGIQQFDHRWTRHFDQVLNCHGIVGSNYNYEGYPDLHGLYLINRVFSKNPWGEIVDRTGQTQYPFQLHIRQPWQIPGENIDLEKTCELTVKQIVDQNPAPYYIYWSGGIDSTLLLVSFLKHVNAEHIKVCCSSASLDENLYFYKNFIKNHVEIIDSQSQLPDDGTHITGDCGDTVWATLDESFFANETTQKQLYQPWQQYFQESDLAAQWRSSKNQNFIEYCEEFFARSGRSIDTLFEARWWFYLNCKSQSKAVYKFAGSFSDKPNIRMVHFYENQYMDAWSWHNVNNMIQGHDWKTYKWPAKDIIFAYDGNEDYRKNKTKGYSSGLEYHRLLKNLNTINNTALFITDNNERPVLDSGPFFSRSLYHRNYHDRYKHLFRS